MNKNYYEILGIDKGASQEDIKKAFRELSKQHHPDHGGDEEKFKELNEAHSVLSDPEKRKDYDNPMRQFPFDIFGFGVNRNRRRYNPNAPRKGKDVKVSRSIPIHFFILGGEIEIKFPFMDLCEECDGKGATEVDMCEACQGIGMISDVRVDGNTRIMNSTTCTKCNGFGAIPKDKCEVCEGRGSNRVNRALKIKVPTGLRDGQVVGAAGMGGRGANGGPPGDFMVKLFMEYPDKLTDEQKKILKEI